MQKKQRMTATKTIVMQVCLVLACAFVGCRRDSADAPRQGYSDQPLRIEKALFTDLDVVKTTASSSTILYELVKY
jgi:hypothetical protein